MNETALGKLLLTLNAGSSSLKFAVFRVGGEDERMVAGSIDRIGSPQSKLNWRRSPEKESRSETLTAPDHSRGLELVLKCIREAQVGMDFAGVGHRIVHGGGRFTTPVVVDGSVIAELKRLSPLSPEHMPSEIALIEGVERFLAGVPQVACFDTAFHHDMPRVARLLPIPRKYDAAGVRRFGFHGLSYEFLMQELRRLDEPASRGRVILAHLGSGASLAAVSDGRCLDTTMGFTPSAGLVMGRRSGDLDPGLPAYLARTEGMSAEQFQEMVNHRSGMLGISETSSDMRELLELEKSDSRAAEAVELFCYQAKKWLGALAGALGGLDLLVFSGGIGEHHSIIRGRICAGLEFLGLELEGAANAAGSAIISSSRSRVAVRVMATDEERMIAGKTRRALGLGER